MDVDLKRLRAALQRAGFKVEFRHPSVKTVYGLFQAKTRTLSISPLAFELGIGRQVFLYEAVHAAQSCPSGVLSPIGWQHSLPPVVEREISGILYNAYHHKNKALEREAFMVQGQPQGVAIVIQALQLAGVTRRRSWHVLRMHRSGMDKQRATERVAVLMTPAEKTAYAEKASSMGLSLGQFFREAGAAYVKASGQQVAEAEALQAALTQLELSTLRAERALDNALAEVRASLRASS